MATKTRKKTTKKAVKASAPHKSVGDCTPRECIRENRDLKLHITIITVLSVIVCVLVAALVIVTIKD